MDARSLAVLELDAVRARLADETAFAGGRALALALAPTGEPDVVETRQAETAEAVSLLVHGAVRAAGASDVREEAAAAERGGLLRPDELLAIAATCRTAVDLRRALLDHEADAPLLAARAHRIAELLGMLADAIEAAVEPDGSGLSDDASPALRELRRRIRTLRRQAAERLQELVRSAGLKDHLQDGIVTERAGRPVIAVKASSRSKVPGIVHDTSGSGQTLFVEPFAVVELQNDVREAVSLERDEVERILKELARRVGDLAGALIDAVDALAEVDLALACGRLAARQRACPVEVADDVELVEARHPLLDPASAVPVDLRLGGLRGIVVSGANTGGKTVAMKTLGLLAVMHQCGLRVPARRARLPVFDAVLADIGDEQSIERSLSTFSGHMARVTAILAAAGARSLVLLDEPAGGTDPSEGASLARAILRAPRAAGAPLRRDDALPGAEGVGERDGRDRERRGRLRPRHARADVHDRDRPAGRLARAPDRGAPRPRRAGRARGPRRDLRGAARDRGAARRRDGGGARGEGGARAGAGRARRGRGGAARCGSRRTPARGGARRRQTGEQRAREEARAAAERELRGAQAELDELRAEIRLARREEEYRRHATTSEADRALRERDRRLDAASRRARSAGSAMADALAQPLEARAPLAVGDPVVAPALGIHGTLVGIEGDTGEVQGPRVRVRVPLDRLVPDGAPRTTTVEDRPVQVRTAGPVLVDAELDLRGRRAEEARIAARDYVDQAHLAGRHEVVVIHGRGTGAVRDAVRKELARHPLVAELVPQSADGATRVRLAISDG